MLVHTLSEKMGGQIHPLAIPEY